MTILWHLLVKKSIDLETEEEFTYWYNKKFHWHLNYPKSSLIHGKTKQKTRQTKKQTQQQQQQVNSRHQLVPQ